MGYVFTLILGILLGLILFPVVLFLRARKDGYWDDSNMTNMIRVISHLCAHPSDFGRFQYEDGTKPFWYIKCDEFLEVTKTRPKEWEKVLEKAKQQLKNENV